jgi:hypothetical protein
MTSLLFPRKERGGGRKPREIQYIPVEYNGKDYIVGFIQISYTVQPFVIDVEDYEMISSRPSWHKTANEYVSNNVCIDGKQKVLYMHNLVMNKLTFDGKGQKETVDHINRIGFDNRKENLRIINQSEQNINQHKKSRRIELPHDCGIDAESIPRHIWYMKANGAHGDRFVIEFKSEKVEWKTTSSKTVSISEKLNQATEKLKELYSVYPHLDPFNPVIVGNRDSLIKSYNNIVTAAKEIGGI